MKSNSKMDNIKKSTKYHKKKHIENCDTELFWNNQFNLGINLIYCDLFPI